MSVGVSLFPSLLIYKSVSCVIVDAMLLCQCPHLPNDPVHGFLVLRAVWIKVEVLVSFEVAFLLGDAQQPVWRRGLSNEVEDSAHFFGEVGQQLLVLDDVHGCVGLGQPHLQHQPPGNTLGLHKPVPLGIAYM